MDLSPFPTLSTPNLIKNSEVIMSSQNILQQIKKLPLPFTSESRSAPDTAPDRPWQTSQQTETCAIASLLNEIILNRNS